MEGRSVGFDFNGLGRLLVRGVRGQLLAVLWSFRADGLQGASNARPSGRQSGCPKGGQGLNGLCQRGRNP